MRSVLPCTYAARQRNSCELIKSSVAEDKRFPVELVLAGGWWQLLRCQYLYLYTSEYLSQGLVARGTSQVLCQYLYFCTSKASKLSTCGWREGSHRGWMEVCVPNGCPLPVRFVKSKKQNYKYSRPAAGIKVVVAIDRVSVLGLLYQ